MIKQSVLTKTEEKVIQKKLNNERMTRQDSYYLSVSIRPKLKQMSLINPKELLIKLRYNQKAISIEKRIKQRVLKSIKNVRAIILYGSVVQTNYSNYKDIDVLVIVKDKIKNQKEKYQSIKSLRDDELNLDVQIITEKELCSQYPHSPSLIYQLKDRKVIYGNISIPKKIEIYNIDLRMKLDWSDIQDNSSQEIYRALRNAILVELLLKKIVDNKVLQMKIEEEVGKKTIDNLKNNKASIEEKKLAKLRLKSLVKKLEDDLSGGIWEKRVQLIV